MIAMPAICPRCQKEITPSAAIRLHTASEHPEMIEEMALKAIATASARVQYIYDTYPEARNSNGDLILLVMRKIYPRAIRYTEKDGIVSITANYKEMAYFLKHAQSLTRLGRHIRQPAATGQYAAGGGIAKRGITTKEAARRIMELSPAERWHEGFLCEKLLRYFPVPGTTCAYSRETQETTITAPKELLAPLLAHLETITRRSRELRRAAGYQGSPVRQEREVEYAFSTEEWKPGAE